MRHKTMLVKPSLPRFVVLTLNRGTNKYDPTNTQGMRRRLQAQMKKIFTRLRSLIFKLIVKEDAFGLIPKPRNPFTGNARWSHLKGPERVRAFRAWLASIMKDTDKSVEEAIDRYIREGFEKGAGRAFDDVNGTAAARAVASSTAEEAASKAAFYEGGRKEFLRSSFAKATTREKVVMLASRTLDEVKGVTEVTARQIVRTLTDGLVQGKSPREIARALTPILEGNKSKATTIARTEIIRAHAEGQLDALENLGVEEVGVAVEWSTAGDERVCPMCAPLQGVILKLKEAKGMLPRHPNCRCSWIPANVGETKSERQQRSQKEVKKAIDRSSKAESGDSSWSGASKRIAKERPKPLVDEKDTQ